jgi:hypothetical protein
MLSKEDLARLGRIYAESESTIRPVDKPEKQVHSGDTPSKTKASKGLQKAQGIKYPPTRHAFDFITSKVAGRLVQDGS